MQQNNQAEILKTDAIPPSWVVEFIDDDGGIEVTNFSGTDADKRAQDYADWRYGGVRQSEAA